MGGRGENVRVTTVTRSRARPRQARAREARGDRRLARPAGGASSHGAVPLRRSPLGAPRNRSAPQACSGHEAARRRLRRAAREPTLHVVAELAAAAGAVQRIDRSRTRARRRGPARRPAKMITPFPAAWIVGGPAPARAAYRPGVAADDT